MCEEKNAKHCVLVEVFDKQKSSFTFANLCLGHSVLAAETVRGGGCILTLGLPVRRLHLQFPGLRWYWMSGFQSSPLLAEFFCRALD
jgi:hypothetical protein